MDRREALTKLGAAGAIVAGGSMVLSSRNVAFAASGECLVAGEPSSISMTIGLNPSNQSNQELNVTASIPAAPPGVTITYFWTNPVAVSPTPAPVTILSGSNTATVVLGVPSAKSKKWLPGYRFTITLVASWSCAGATTNEGTYVLTHTLTPSPQTVTVPLSPT